MPRSRISSIKLIFAVCAALDWEDFLADVSGAYTLAKKKEAGVGSTTYVRQPQGFEQFGPNGEQMVGVLDYYLYGDPAAGREWQAMFRDVLKKELGAEADDVDPNLWKIVNDVGHAIFATHVDEMVGAADTPAMRDWVEEKLKAALPISTFEAWSTVLGYGVRRDRSKREVRVNATKVIDDMFAARFPEEVSK